MANKIKLAGTSSNTFSVGLQGATISSNAVSTPYTLTLPATTGSNAQVLSTDGTGTLTWVTQSGGGGGAVTSIIAGSGISVSSATGDVTITATGGGGGGSPGGTNTQVQFNNNGVFGGISTVTYNGTSLNLGPVANINISGGTNGYVLQTNGTGALSWVAQSGGGGSTVTDFTPSFFLGGM
jgi:hypothetical protein